MKTTQEKCIIVAEACGWTFPPTNDSWTDIWGVDPMDKSLRTLEEIKQRFSSIDAIRAAVLAQDEEFQNSFAQAMFIKAKAIDRDRAMFHQLTALDWLDCFVETVENRKAK